MSVTINASTSSGLVQTADTSGTVEIQSNGTTKLTVASTGVSGTLINGTAVASTSGTSIEFTSIPSWVKRITVMFNAVSTNGTGDIKVQLGSTTYTISGYVANISVLGASAVASASNTTGLIVSGASAALALSGNLVITNITGNTWTYTSSTAKTDGVQTNHCAGVLALGGVLDRLRIIGSATGSPADTFDAGSINIQYEG